MGDFYRKTPKFFQEFNGVLAKAISLSRQKDGQGFEKRACREHNTSNSCLQFTQILLLLTMHLWTVVYKADRLWLTTNLSKNFQMFSDFGLARTFGILKHVEENLAGVVFTITKWL